MKNKTFKVCLLASGMLLGTTAYAQSTTAIDEQPGACLFLSWLDANSDTLSSLASMIEDVDAWLLVGYQLFEENRYAETIHACEECLELKPLCFSAILMRGLSRIRLGAASGWEDIVLGMSPDRCCRVGCPARCLSTEAKRWLEDAANILLKEHREAAVDRLSQKCDPEIECN